eukprot:scaffold581_cov127-Skeletonema_marinoi.AAC.16
MPRATTLVSSVLPIMQQRRRPNSCSSRAASMLLLFTIVSYLLLSSCSADEQSNLIFGRASMTANDHDAALVGMDSQKYNEEEEFALPYLGSAAAERRRHIARMKGEQLERHLRHFQRRHRQHNYLASVGEGYTDTGAKSGKAPSSSKSGKITIISVASHSPTVSPAPSSTPSSSSAPSESSPPSLAPSESSAPSKSSQPSTTTAPPSRLPSWPTTESSPSSKSSQPILSSTPQVPSSSSFSSPSKSSQPSNTAVADLVGVPSIPAATSSTALSLASGTSSTALPLTTQTASSEAGTDLESTSSKPTPLPTASVREAASPVSSSPHKMGTFVALSVLILASLVAAI